MNSNIDIIKRSTILYVNQVRQEDFEVLIGKGFSEAFSWRYHFKKIIFVCFSSTNNYIYKKLYDNCYLIGIPFNLSVSTSKSIFNICKNYVKMFLFLFRLSKIIKINVVRMENLLLSGPSVFLLNKVIKVPYIIWLGGHERKALYFKYGKNISTWFLAKLIKIYEKIILKNANFVFAVTEELLDLTEERNVKNKILSPNYVNLSIFEDNHLNSSGEHFQILYVGRFEEEKGIKVLLNAIKILVGENSRFELSMVGDGSLTKWITTFIKKNKIENVKLLGKFTHEEMPEVYNQADIFVLPSFTEGSPASLIEAMSCGMASIATNVGECVNIIKNGQNGILIPSGDPLKLSEAIMKLINNKDLFEKIRKNGRNTIIKYTRNYTKIHKYVYKRVLEIFN